MSESIRKTSMWRNQGAVQPFKFLLSRCNDGFLLLHEQPLLRLIPVARLCNLGGYVMPFAQPNVE